VTDLPPDLGSIPSRLGTRFSVDDDGNLTGVLAVHPGMCDRGVVPAYALLFLADVVAGVTSDTDREAWAFTADASVRAPLEPAPVAIGCATTELRGGRGRPSARRRSPSRTARGATASSRSHGCRAGPPTP
jgi:hypothetical protein